MSFLISQISFGQVSTQINLNIELAEKDSITSGKIQSSLNGFLTEAFEGKYIQKIMLIQFIEKNMNSFSSNFQKLVKIQKQTLTNLFDSEIYPVEKW